MSANLWQISEEKVKEQVEGYETLKITKSYRGISALLVLLIVAMTILLSSYNQYAFESLYGSIAYLPIAYFIWKGHRWAMVVMMIFWTLDKGYQLFASGGSSPVLVVLIWAVFMRFFVNAFLIELARRKSKAPVVK